MDASKYVSAKGDRATKTTDIVAIRMAMANALRDLADEIEAGTRAVAEMQTFERVAANQHPTSILHVVSYLTTLPSMESKKQS